MFGFAAFFHLFMPMWSLLSFAGLSAFFYSYVHRKSVSIKDEKACKPILWGMWGVSVIAFGTSILFMLFFRLPSISYLHSEWGVAPDPRYNFALSLITFGAIALVVFALLLLLSYVFVLSRGTTDDAKIKNRVFWRLYFINCLLYIIYYMISTLIEIS